MVLQKIQALVRATEYFSGKKIPTLDLNIHDMDIYTVLLKIFPILSKFLIETLFESLEPLMIAAIKILEFFIEHLGCTMGKYLPIILKSIL